MTIFIFIPWFHPAYRAGGPIQSITNLIENFYENISYKIFCSDKDLGDIKLNVQTDKWIRFNKNTQVWYASKNELSIKVIKREIEYSNPNLLFINGIYSWYFNIVPILFCNAKRKIISTRGMLHPGALSQKNNKKKLYLFMLKIFGIHRKYQFHATDIEEKNYIKKIFGANSKIYVAQNFPHVFPMQTSPVKQSGYLIMISIALISAMKNHLLILQSLAECSENIIYNIYGPVKDEIYWNVCCDQIKKLPANITVNYFGDIQPHDVVTALSKNQIFILPSKSENFGHAMYEALSAGKPLITSNNTPWNSLAKNKAGININPERPDEIIKAIKFFAEMDNIEFLKFCKAASLYAFNAVNIDSIKMQYHKMFSA